jgi:hypothetical protein
MDIMDIYISGSDLSLDPKFFGFFFFCKFECGWGLENTPSKRHGLIQLRSIKNVDSGIVSMNAIYEGK